MRRPIPSPPKDPPAEPSEAFARDEIRGALYRPHLAAEYVLGRPDRLAGNLARVDGLPLLSLLLFLAGILFAVPFGAVPPVASFWKVSLLFTGSVVICFPSLHVFSLYLGLRLDLAQNLVLGLVISAVAGIFTFGFFPIMWFIDYTTEGASAGFGPKQLASFFLTISLLMGVVHLVRCQRLTRGSLGRSPLFCWLLGLWTLLLLFITYRMAVHLELF
ncbi:MAG: hypothetical protein ACYTDY_06820 [Planctomycetota bacterium]|jgi:hypothetical protein